MKRLSYILLLVLISGTSWGQNIKDALNLSDYRIQGTARSAAMGNAFGALGGDFTSASINPAGIGVFRSSEFEFTLAQGSTDMDATYLGNKSTASRSWLNIPNMGYVATFKSNSPSVVSFNIGLGYNRMKDFNTREIIRGDNANSSMLDEFVDNANVNNWSEYYEGLAYKTGVLPFDTVSGTYWDDLNNGGYGQSQRKSIIRKGNINEYIFSMAANFNNRFYLGATIGIQDVYFKESTSFIEEDVNNNIDVFNSYDFRTYQKTTGTGINLKIGAIYKPIPALRLGLALHTPTYYNLHDYFYTGMNSSITNNDSTDDEYEANSTYSDYDYDFNSPMEAILSAAYVIGNKGLISVDYEYKDYSNGKFSSDNWEDDDSNFDGVNSDIEKHYQSSGNLHIGGEFRPNQNFSVRGGFEYYQSPYSTTITDDFGNSLPNKNKDANTKTYSIGIGWQMNGFFADLTYKNLQRDNYIYLYDSAKPAKIKMDRDYLMMTIGFRF